MFIMVMPKPKQEHDEAPYGDGFVPFEPDEGVILHFDHSTYKDEKIEDSLAEIAGNVEKFIASGKQRIFLYFSVTPKEQERGISNEIYRGLHDRGFSHHILLCKEGLSLEGYVRKHRN